MRIDGFTGNNAKRQGVCYAIDREAGRGVHWNDLAGPRGVRKRRACRRIPERGYKVCWGGSLAFGLTVVTMAYAIGDVSGCHLNPAVTFGLVLGGRHPAKELPYWIVQVLGGIVVGPGAALAVLGRALAGRCDRCPGLSIHHAG
jgi:Major intrinsic protein